MKAGNKQAGSRLRVVLEPDVAIGPGKADILEGIKETGSIAAAGRRMGMSYKRAWSLVEAMNRDFAQPLVRTSKGGRTHGGTELTDTGAKVLALYRNMESRAEAAIAADMKALRKLLADIAK
ncbi:MAG: winged helix-turn-helix domain-containing protein [Bacteroidota bacterium]|nr:LysR family transcriptional regulator [Kiloniellaceae bacterium]